MVRQNGRVRRTGGDAPTPGSAADLAADADPQAVARSIALRQLTLGPRTRSQLADAMAARSVPAEVADAVLQRFTDVGLVDDAEFAQTWVTSRHSVRGLARRALAAELRRKGVDDEVAREALEGLPPETEQRTARALVDKKLPSLRGLDPARRMNRLAGMLARKGYPPSFALRVVREALAGEGTSSPRINEDEDG